LQGRNPKSERKTDGLPDDVSAFDGAHGFNTFAVKLVSQNLHPACCWSPNSESAWWGYFFTSAIQKFLSSGTDMSSTAA